MLRPDVVLEILLSSTLVAAQAAVINYLGLPFAAITLFAGFGAYLVAAGTIAGATHVTLVALAALACLALFVGLRRPLPSDRFLLVTLAALAIAEAVAGGLKDYGGQLGAPASWAGLPTYDAGVFLPGGVFAFAAVMMGLVALEKTELGLAVEVARLSLLDRRLGALVPVTALSVAILGAAAFVAVAVGAVGALYTGRASPDSLGLGRAISFLIATLLVGRRAWIVGVVSIAFFAFPYVFSSALGYQLEAMAHVRELFASGFVLFFGERILSGGQALAGEPEVT